MILSSSKSLSPGAERQDLLPELLAVLHHAVQIESEKVRLHLLEQLREPVEMIVPVMQVVDDADVLELQCFDHGDLVLRLAGPTAVVVERDLAPELSPRPRRLVEALSRRLPPSRFDPSRVARRTSPTVAA